MTRPLTILHTNDLHSQYEKWLQLATVIRQRRAELQTNGTPCLLLDGGDHIDMSVPECLATEGHLNVELYGELGYHAMGVGNNELMRFTLEQVRTLSRLTPAPWLLTNVREADGSMIGGMQDKLLLDVDGITVGLTGITALFPEIYEGLMGLKTFDAIKAIRQASNQLREEGAQLIILLSHDGYDNDLQNAAELSGLVDVIIGAHSHTVVEEPVLEAGVLVVQTGSHGRFLGELRLELDEATGKIVQYKGRLHPIEETIPFDDTQALILEKGKQQVNEMMSEVLTTLEQALSHDELVTEIAAKMRDFYKADIGLMFGAIATEGLAAGPVTVGDIYRTCASLVCVAHLEMQGRQLLGLLQERQNPDITERHVYGNGFRPKGIAIGTLQFAGLTWREENGVCLDVRVNGEPLDPERWYTVGTGEHLHYPDICGYPSLAGSKLLQVDDYFYVRDAFAKQLRKAKVTQA